MPYEDGILFPADETGKRSTTATNRAIWADAVRPVDPELADRIMATADWRKNYVALVRAVTEAGGRSATAAREIARAGLASAGSRLVLRRDGREQPVDAFDAPVPGFFETGSVEAAAEPADALVVPYRGAQLSGDRLREQIERWVRGGIIEPSAAAALGAVIDHPDWLTLSGRQIVVLGAGAETSPLPVLASWGADVIAVDLPRPALWKRLLTQARGAAGRVRYPVRADGTAGADLITEMPEVAGWLRGFAADEPLVLGFYVYADGPLHVQATAAGDALATALGVPTAYAGTPSDCYLVPPDVVEGSDARRRSRGLRRPFELSVRGASFGRLYAPAYPELLHGEDGFDWGVADALVKQQGPNYALAKRLQRWRAAAAWADGRSASFNVAPPTWTRSVTKNRLLAAGYYGAHLVGMEVFEPTTMRTLMTALLVHDLNTTADETHPELRVASRAVHGGYWRQPFEIRSTLTYTAMRGLPRAYAPTLRFR